MKSIKYPIREINLNAIKSNRVLAVSVNTSETAFIEKNIRQHGLLTPVIIVEKRNGEQITVCGEAEVQALKNMGVAKTDALISEIKDEEDVGKITLLMSGLKRSLNPVAEGIILKDMLSAGKFTQKELAVKLKKSQGWISKRLSLAHNLKDSVVEMVLAKMICPRSAEEISKMPQDLQHDFSIELSKVSLSKSSVEKLVMNYRKDSTPKSLKEEIISNPSAALLRIKENVVIKPVEIIPDVQAKKLDSAIRLFLKLGIEIEEYILSIGKETISKYLPLLTAVRIMCERIKHILITHIVEADGNSPGNNLISEREETQCV